MKRAQRMEDKELTGLGKLIPELPNSAAEQKPVKKKKKGVCLKRLCRDG